MKPTNVFAYKGYIGIQCEPDATGMINDPTQPGQMGIVMDLSHMRFTTEAVELLKTLNKSRGSLGDIMCWKAGEQRCFAWMGGYYMMFKPENVEADRDYNPSLIPAELIDDTIEASDDFKEAVDDAIRVSDEPDEE
jgi:hypothetical protein